MAGLLFISHEIVNYCNVNNKNVDFYLLTFLICVGICTLITAEQKRDEINESQWC